MSKWTRWTSRKAYAYSVFAMADLLLTLTKIHEQVDRMLVEVRKSKEVNAETLSVVDALEKDLEALRDAVTAAVPF